MAGQDGEAPVASVGTGAAANGALRPGQDGEASANFYFIFKFQPLNRSLFLIFRMPSGRAGQRAAASTGGHTRCGEIILEPTLGFSRGRRRRERCYTPVLRPGRYLAAPSILFNLLDSAS